MTGLLQERLVVDASIAVKRFIAEADSDAAAEIFLRSIEFTAPDLLRAEFGNIVWKKVQRGQLLAVEAEEIVRVFLESVQINFVPTAELLPAALTIALRYQRSVYDSLYLALAVRERCQMITADTRLYNRLQGTEMGPFVVTLGRY